MCMRGCRAHAAVDLPDQGAGWCEASPQALVDAISKFLHG